MRHIWVGICLTMLVLGPVGWADQTAPDSASQVVLVNTSAQPNEVRDYKVTAVVKGKLPGESGTPADIDAEFLYKIRHRYSRREGDGLLPLEISLLEGEVTAQGQKLALAPDLYPKLTLLIDKNWKITDVFGLPDPQLMGMLPGINYGNLFILFYFPGGATPRTVGSVWEALVTFPGLGHTYKFINTLSGVETISGVKAAVVRQEITRVTSPEEDISATMKAAAESAFSIADGKLLRSHVECEVRGRSKGTVEQVPAQPTANIKIDIALAR